MSVMLVGKDLGACVLQSFPLTVKDSLAMVEGGLAGAKDLKLTM
jgi:hypothetical protein